MIMDPKSNIPIIYLKSIDDDQGVFIWIGILEAASIASALQNVTFDRPMTHDLFKNLVESLKMTVSNIEIYDLKENTYYAKINFLSEESSFSIDARPSDAIAIALRSGALIYVDDKVFEKFKHMNGDTEIFDTSEEGKKWAEYLKNLKPEDFSKYKV
ncbi:MAG: bifunctional nuclease family protein [Maribacter sp.]|nr:bifunctional nuclease family protein [Maribacter sp.]